MAVPSWSSSPVPCCQRPYIIQPLSQLAAFYRASNDNRSSDEDSESRFPGTISFPPLPDTLSIFCREPSSSSAFILPLQRRGRLPFPIFFIQIKLLTAGPDQEREQEYVGTEVSVSACACMCACSSSYNGVLISAGTSTLEQVSDENDHCSSPASSLSSSVFKTLWQSLDQQSSASNTTGSN